MDQKTKEKIKALSLKTVANGASPSEAAAAKEMIARLLGKSQEPSNEEKTNVRSPEKETIDDLARYTLNNDYYADYLFRTHPFWVKYNETRLGLSGSRTLTKEQYEAKCVEIYDTLIKEMKEDEQYYRRKTKN